MLDIRDYELQKNPGEPPQPPRQSIARRFVVIALIAATAIAAYIVFGGHRTQPPVTRGPESIKPSEPPVQPLGAESAPIVLPPLDASDALVRDLVKQVSTHPRVAAWLTTDGLIRNFTVVVANIADGRPPARHLGVLRPSATFRVIERGDALSIDPRSYERYDALTAAAASLDPQGSARLYATLKPRIEEAYRELGVPDTPFDRTLERAIVILLGTPVLDDPVLVEPRGVGYGFAAADVEALSHPQKHLLRTGPRNVRLIQASLREIALALGIPAERLPRPRP